MDNPDLIQDIIDFHKRYDLEYSGPPRALPEDLVEFRKQFMFEEAIEYADAQMVNDQEGMFDALIDIVYVVLGTAHLHGYDFAEGWRRVHAANMKKVRAKMVHESKRSSIYDVVKPDGWQPPRLDDLVGGKLDLSDVVPRPDGDIKSQG